jgi:uncharacterized membrane protein required for colicin V production
MPELSLFDISFTTLAIGVVALYAVFGFIKGVFRQIWGMVCLAAGAVTGYFLFQNGGEWLGSIIDHPSGSTVLGSSILGGAAVWLGGKGIVRKVYRGLSGSTKQRSMTGRLLGAVVSLAPAGFLVWVVATVLRLTGTVAEMGHIDQALKAEGGALAEAPSFLTHIRRDLDSSWLGNILKRTDPFTSEAGHQLASLLVVYGDSEAWERLRQNHPEIAKLLDTEKVQRVLNDRGIRNSVELSDHASLLTRPEILEAVSDPALAQELTKLDVQQSAEAALFEPTPEEPKRKKRRFFRKLLNRGGRP